MNARHILLLALSAFGITLAILIGLRLSTEALAILLGVLIGVAASLPSTLILAWAIHRQPPTTAPAPAPTITILPSPLATPTLPPVLQLSSHPAPAKRQFIVIGGDELTD